MAAQAVRLATAEGALGAEDASCVARLAREALDPALAEEERRAQAGLRRCLFGNPFRPVALDPGWRTRDVLALAREAHGLALLGPGGAFEPARLHVLADALEEAGAPGELVGHLRGPGPHVPGCHAVDAALGRR
jgi:hypothetical protein